MTQVANDRQCRRSRGLAVKRRRRALGQHAEVGQLRRQQRLVRGDDRFAERERGRQHRLHLHAAGELDDDVDLRIADKLERVIDDRNAVKLRPARLREITNGNLDDAKADTVAVGNGSMLSINQLEQPAADRAASNQTDTKLAQGLDAHALHAFLGEQGRLPEFPGAQVISSEELLSLECDLFVPAALGGMIHRDNADLLNCRVIVEGANSPTTPTADEILTEKGVTIVPDLLANAGGVVVSYFEWVQNLQHFRWDETEVNQKLERVMQRAYGEVSARAEADGGSLRIAAFALGIERVLDAARIRGYIS